MTETPGPDRQATRFAPRAAREMAGMFDDVSGRYDWLNRLMTFGQDAGWRRAMARAIPRDAIVVLDLCTGSGVSAEALRRPGRTVLGIDVSMRMLRRAEDEFGGPGWSPRFVCADGFALPVRDGVMSAVTIAFGIRNLRPRARALAELRRVLAPGGTLAVLEATAPEPGPLAPFARAWIRHGIPLLGRMSRDPSAYRYLSQSIFEFGTGPGFERDLRAAGFEVTSRRSFMFGSTWLWTARSAGTIAAVRPPALRNAMPGTGSTGAGGATGQSSGIERRVWNWVNAAVSGILLAALVEGAFAFAKWAPELPLESWQRLAIGILLGLGIAGFSIRTAWLLRRAIESGPPP